MSCPKRPQNPTPIKGEHTEKGCIHWIDFNSGQSISSNKARPWIIISRNNVKSSRVILSPLSDMEHYIDEDTKKLKYPYHAPLFKKDHPFLDKDSVVLLDQAYTIAKAELCEEWYSGKISETKNIDDAIMYNYDLFESIKVAFTELLSQYETLHKSKYSRQ